MIPKREIWKNIPDWPLHQASNLGRIRALVGAQIKSRRVNKIELRKLTVLPIGYVVAGNALYVHRMVLLAFRGKPPFGMQARHLNGNRADNRLCNLEWGTRSTNENDKIEHGRSNRGEKNGQAKLTAADIVAIRAINGPRGIISRLAEHYDVSHATISVIRTNKRWRHVP